MKKAFAIVFTLFLLMNSFTISNSLAAQSVKQNDNTSTVVMKDGYLYVKTNGVSKKVNLKIKFYSNGQSDYILACSDSSNKYKYVLINKNTLAIRKLNYSYTKKFCDDSKSPILGCKNNKYYFISQNLLVESNGTIEKVLYNSRISKTDIEQFNLSKVFTSSNKIVFSSTLAPEPFLVIDTRNDTITDLKMVQGGFYELIGITDNRICYTLEDHIQASTDTVYVYMSDYDTGNSKKLMPVRGGLYDNYSAQIGDKVYFSNYSIGIYVIDLSKEASKHIFERPVAGLYPFDNKIYFSTICDECYKSCDSDFYMLNPDSIGFLNVSDYHYTNKLQIKESKIGKDFIYSNDGIYLANVDYNGNYYFKFGIDCDNSVVVTCKYDIQKKKVTILDMYSSFLTTLSPKKFADLKKKYIGKDITKVFLLK